MSQPQLTQIHEQFVWWTLMAATASSSVGSRRRVAERSIRRCSVHAPPESKGLERRGAFTALVAKEPGFCFLGVILNMKLPPLAAALLVVSCARSNNEITGFSDLVFISNEKNVDVIDVDGINLGSLYGRSPLSPKNIGEKTYVTSQGLFVEEHVTISWRYSSNRAKEEVNHTKIIRSSLNIPERIPAGSALHLVFSDHSWTMNVSEQ